MKHSIGGENKKIKAKACKDKKDIGQWTTVLKWLMT